MRRADHISRGHSRRLALLLACVLVVLAACSARTPQPRLSEVAQPVTSPGWVRLRPEARIPPRDFLRLFAKDLDIAEGTQWTLLHEETDELGISHLRYQQQWRGLEVEGAQFLIHARDTSTLSANGRLAMRFAPESAPAIDEGRAWEAARAAVPAELFYDPARLKESVEAGSTPNRPPGTLLYASTAVGENRWEWVLAWRFDVYTAPMERSTRVYVDARTGAVLKTQMLMPPCFTTSGTTTFRGNQQFNTAQRGDRFALTDDCHGTQLRYRDLDSTGTKVQDLLDGDNNWADQDAAKVTSFWALGVAYDYFDLIHRRKGYDGANAEITIVNQPALGNGANGGSGFINIGLGSTGAANDDYNTTDIVAHEFTHNVIEKSAGLAYDASKESAALNESYSDIFGVMVDAWEKRNQSPNWIIGGDKGCSGAAICRNLINPKQFGNPDTYKGLNWQSAGSVDPHNNGTVNNRWFALVATGGSGTNSETSQAYAITGIGIEKARRIAYRTLTRYLVASSDYVAARNGSIQAATDLFGDGSAEEGAVTQAWCAVGMCPWTPPTQPDRFDRPGGNPNPASPDNNNTEGGATPINVLNWTVLGARRPTLRISDLSLFPAGDADNFRITVPESVGLGGACFPKGVAFSFTVPVDVRALVDGRTTQFEHDTQYVRVPASGTFVLQVSAPFAALVMNYAVRGAFFQSVDPHCWQTEPPSIFERIQDCPMCDVEVLRGIDEIVLDPDYRQPELVAPAQHVFRFAGGRLSMPIAVTNGRALVVELLDASGRSIQQLRWDGGAPPVLQAADVPAGIYGLRFNGYRNGTRLRVQTPRSP